MIFGKAALLAVQLMLPIAEFDAIDEPIWCAGTEGLLAQIASLGGQSVKRLYLEDGRRYEWYWSDREELIIEHNPGGSSCLVRLSSPDR